MGNVMGGSAFAYGWSVTPPDLKPGIVARLRAAGCVFAEDEADVLLATTTDPTALDTMVSRRATGVPLEQVVGWAEFAGVRVAVQAGVFVPRRRTEALVRAAVAVTDPGATVLELCCGTGAIGAAIATAVPSVRLWASDIDPVAVRCAQENLAVFQAEVVLGDVDDALPSQLRDGVDVLVANVPYVPSAEVDYLPAEARMHEPSTALDGGVDGLAVLRRVAVRAPYWLRPGGWLFTECSQEQADAAAAVLRDAGLVASVAYDDDLDVAIVSGQRSIDDDHLRR
jgi:release factor glutamine methyltransferase